MTLIKHIENLFNSLVEATAILNDALHNAPLINAVCYKLPVETGNHEVDTGWQFISPTQYSDFNALVMATASYAKFTPDYDYSPKYPFRLPGLIQYPLEFENHISYLVGQCNLIKDQIRLSLVRSELNPAQKRTIIQTVCPNAITLQIYRLINCPVGPAKRVGFTWCNKNSMRRINKNEFIKYLKNSINNPPAGLNKAEWQPYVSNEIELIEAERTETIKIKRPLPVVPKLNVSFKDDTKGVMLYAHTPTIIFGDTPAEISPLKQYINEVCKVNLNNYLIKRLYVLSTSD